ncbi:hypothetical protein EDC04DRAFT_617731 [Pisolithus marmoratus]|nr:hypothetical protein EDC04DRAFT_617731 [Pisolithus marmoratus]
MAFASKAYTAFNTPTKLTQLDDARLIVLGVEDKELRKSILAAVRKAGYTKSDATRPKKKRRRDSDLNERLQESPFDEGSTCGNLDFEEILDEEILRSKTAVVNRAPVMTAWAMIVAERLGFDREESLSIASVYTEMNAVSKGVSLGLIEERRKKDIETLPEGKQPYIDLMGRRQDSIIPNSHFQMVGTFWRLSCVARLGIFLHLSFVPADDLICSGIFASPGRKLLPAEAQRIGILALR